MRYDRVHIESLAHETPPIRLTSEELEERLAPCYSHYCLQPGFLFEHSGVKARHLWDPGQTLSGAAAAAATKALARTHLKPEDIGSLVMCSISKELVEPATAVLIHEKLGLPEESMAFDLTNACLGWMNGLTMVANQIELGQIKAGLVITAEDIGPVLQATVPVLNERNDHRYFKKSFATLTMGSCAAAAVLTHESVSRTSHRLVGGHQMTFSKHNQLCRSSSLEEPVFTDVKGLLKNGLESAEVCWHRFLDDFRWKPEEVGLSIFHQVSQVHRDTMCRNLGLNPETNPMTLDEYGNVGSCSVPLTFSVAAEQGLARPGRKVSINAIGSGLVVMMMGVEW